MNISSLTNDELLKLREALEFDVSGLDAIQQAYKIGINSLYGALGSDGFRHYNQWQCSAITYNGQTTTKTAENYFNNSLQALTGVDRDYVIAADTDSNYVDFSLVIKKLGFVDTPTIVDSLSKFAKDRVQPGLKQAFKQLGDKLNCDDEKIVMKRESIGPAIFIQKKRYLMRVWDKEGVRYETPKLKVMGLEAIKTNTPLYCRKRMKELFTTLFDMSQQEVQAYVKTTREEFMNLSPYEIASPTSVNNLSKYVVVNQKGATMHANGAVLYNSLLQKHKLSDKYPLIRSGDKIRYVRLEDPNPHRASAISFLDVLPPELGLDKYLDKVAQFNKHFMDPVDRVLKPIGWSAKKKFRLG